ncbi:hybrid non-ribosomal peptide synthetase/type I polyketide synthase [Streptomyces sp. WMMB 322]|uniref:hybrid non-ribosomal peptide synthetase/type I polyketide synthase n=1 Tax=Streptomyces sp. WMMB 322 TaxID=1286821 RepID=UPI0006E1EDBC|nr:hybrid non-ribosomal peptide synthetase/type I polyketide synthase [Streptomyces sp. WMMB 322]SCK55867.1 amino acid adenylation domain-containing protein [Streptomyces sp. WMMB 322]
MTTSHNSTPSEPAADGDVAVIGMAGRFPGAADVASFWQNLRSGTESVTFFGDAELREKGVPEELVGDPAFVKAGSVLDGPELFDAAFFGYNARDAAMVDPQQRLLLETAHAALEDAGCVPALFPGSIAVYAGSSLSTYLISNLLTAGPGFDDIADVTELLTTNDKDYLATRISYGLGLDGPAVSVQTACSSSLVAVHMAVQGLLGHECDVALVGGASLRLPQGRGYLHRQGMIFSADGHTRSFDARCSGTMFGSGVGAVVLKRLVDAVADGDRIDAVVKGSAVTNDGSAKVGYTAPGVDGQARAIAGALGVGEVEPDTVTALEGHGTATPLGDPIEVTALSRVFSTRTAASASCALSSVKSNVGHLAEAAGITGFVKAVLQLRHRQLAPSLNFDEPNPELRLDETRFRVVTELEDWRPDAMPRRIGVSSFGMGGTNAHVVLEEGPEPATSVPFTRDLFLLPLSARTPASLEAATDGLAAALAGTEDLSDTATTLQQGRAAHGHRRLVVAAGAAEAQQALETRDSASTATSAASPEPRIALMFPGQGSQYPGMARLLYEQEPVFSECVDTCADLLFDELGHDLREVMHPAATTDPGAAAGLLRQTSLAQPALFVVGYALAGLLESVGVRPDAMIGHSVGEIVAACRAGVFSLPDALRLVAVRGRLMQELPPGGMLSVALPEEEVLERLPEGLSLAAVNAPDVCAVSGPGEQLRSFARLLDEQGTPVRELHTSHAFHSAMVEPMMSRFADELSCVDFHEPSVPYVENRTGDWITPQRATDPDHWVHHIREPVRFSDGVLKLTESGPCVLLEAGPGATLSTLARSTVRARGSVTVPLLPSAGEERDDVRQFMLGLGRVWTAGGDIDWNLVQGGRARRTGLPTYPFERRRYWIDAAPGVHGAKPGGYVLQAADEEQESGGGGEPAPLGAFDPRPALTTEYAEPRDDRDRRLVTIWQELLGVAPVGVHDNYMELGGHSLLAARMVERVKADLGTGVKLGDLLAEPTVAGLAALLEESGVGAGEPRTSGATSGGAVGTGPERGDGELPVAQPDPERLHEPFPLSEMQQAQWIGRQDSFEGGNVAAHVYWEVELGADVDVARLEEAWQRVVERHHMLRAVIGDDGRQRILDDTGPYRFGLLDLRDASAEEGERRLAELREKHSREVRPADEWPLFDVRITLLPQGRARLHFSFDLLIADIGSIRLLVRDWRRYYQGRDDEIRPLRISYRDYVLASEELRGTALYERSLAYWRERVTELPPGPDLPLALSPGSLKDPEFTARNAQLGTEQWNAFKERAAAAGVTPSAALLTAYAAALGTWSRSASFTLNVTVINRLQVHEDVRDLVGEFASFDLLPVDLSRAESFGSLASAVQRQSWADLEHRYLNGVDILREMARMRGGTSGSVMPVVFTSTLVQENEAEDASMFGWLGRMEHEIAQTPQVWLDFAVMENAEGVQLSWHWVRQLFPEGVIEEVFDAFQRLVTDLAASDETWHSTVRCPPPPAQRQITEGVNATEGPLHEDFLYAPLMARAAEHPDRVAVVSASGAELTYGRLRAHACVLAHRLRGLGAGPGRLIAVAVEKGCEQIVAALAVQLAGAAYLPVDPALPAERQDHLCERGEVRLVLVPEGGSGHTWAEGIREVEVGLGADPDGPGADGTPPEPVQSPGDLAYTIFTSGSTGEPKGVMLSHRAALNTLTDINERFCVGPGDAVLGLSSLSFDLSVYDVFGVLGAGGRLVLPLPGTSRDPGHWDELVRRHGVTLWNSVPALLRMYVEHLAGQNGAGGDGDGGGARAGLDAGPGNPLRLALMSGDWIPVELPAQLRELIPQVEPVSLGGATEAAVWSIWHPIDPEADGARDSVPYGTPLRNQTFHVLNDRMETCPVWVTGELYIGGAGLAEGYWRDEERTRASLVTWPETGERLYRTGDLGRRLPDGTLEFLGREDFQVKIGGFRIELGEIEAALARHDGVRAAVAAAPGDRHNRRLVAYVVPDAAEPARTPEWDEAFLGEVRALAEEVLPSYMVPTVFLVLDRLPLSANGKVDRGALPDPARAGGGSVAAQGPVAARLVEIVAEVVGVSGIGPRDNFFSVGGNSIMGIQIVSRANAEGLEFTAADLFRHETLEELAAELESRGATVAGAASTEPLTRRQRQLVEWAAPGLPAGVHRAELRVGPEVESAWLESALAAVTQRHTALHTRLAEADGGWRAVRTAAEADEPAVPDIDLTALPEGRRERAFTSMVEEMGGELCPQYGPVAKAALFRLGESEQRMVWLVHELCVDGGSWRALLGDLHVAVEAAANGKEPALPVQDPLRVRALTALAGAEENAAGAPGADTTEDAGGTQDAGGPDGSPLPAPPPVVELDEGDTRHSLQAQLTEEETAELLRSTSATYRLTPSETVAAAFALAVSAAGGPPLLRYDLEYELRGSEEAGAGAEFTAGSFNSHVTLMFRAGGDGTAAGTGTAGSDDVGTLLRSVKEQCRTGTLGDGEPSPPSPQPAQVLVRHLGELDLPAGAHLLPAGPPALDGAGHPVTLSTHVAQDRLLATLTCRAGEPSGARLAAVLDALPAAFRRITEHCRDTGRAVISPGDFPLAGLDQNTLDTFLGALAGNGEPSGTSPSQPGPTAPAEEAL